MVSTLQGRHCWQSRGVGRIVQTKDIQEALPALREGGQVSLPFRFTAVGWASLMPWSPEDEGHMKSLSNHPHAVRVTCYVTMRTARRGTHPGQERVAGHPHLLRARDSAINT